MILSKLGIYGWKKKDENLLLASLLTGDPLLLIGNHGCVKTHTKEKWIVLRLRSGFIDSGWWIVQIKSDS